MGDDKGGFIVRTQAEGATDEELQGDHTYLRTLWNSIQEKAKAQPTPSVLYTDLTLAQRVLRDMVGPHTGTIQVDSRSTTSQLLEWAKVYTPSVLDRIRHYSGERPLFDRSEERRVGKECVSTCRSRWPPCH